MNDTIKGIEGLFRLGGPTYEVMKKIESYLEEDMGKIPDDTCFYTIAGIDDDETTFYTNAEIIVASNEFKGYIIAYEHIQLIGVLKYNVLERDAAILDAYVEPDVRRTGVFSSLHKLYTQLVQDMSSYKIYLDPEEVSKKFRNELTKEEIAEQIEINKEIAVKLGYNTIEDQPFAVI